MSYPLDGRSLRLEVFKQGEASASLFDGADFRLDFDLELTGSYALNKATFKLYNPNETTIAKAREQGATLRFFAGYRDVTPRLFLGQVTRSVVERDNVDIVLTIEAKDGAGVWRTGRISRSWRRPITALQIAQAICNDVGVTLRVVGRASIEDIPYPNGYAVEGTWRDTLESIASSLGLEFSIEDGAAVLVREGQPLSNQIALVSPASGLIGRPEIRKRRVVTATSLLRGDVRPRRLFALEARDIQGTFRATKVKHTGSSWTNPYYTKITGTRVRTVDDDS